MNKTLRFFLMIFLFSRITVFVCFVSAQNINQAEPGKNIYTLPDILKTKNPFLLPGAIKEKIATDKALFDLISSDIQGERRVKDSSAAALISGKTETIKNKDIVDRYKNEIASLKLEGCVWQGNVQVAIINGKTFKEGDLVSAGLKLIKILRDKIELKAIDDLTEEKKFTVGIFDANKERKK